MNSKIQKFHKKLISFIITLCLLIGLVPFVTMPAQAANYWDGWTLIEASTTGRTLTAGNYRIENDVTVSNSNTGGSGITITAGATVTIYIPSDVTLTATGAAGSGTVGGGAGILLPSNSTLIIRGGGTLTATGGDGAQAAAGSTGGNPTEHTNSFSTAAGGNGGRGGSGAGAGIGGNGGAGGVGAGGAVAFSEGNKGENGINGRAPTSDGSVGLAGGSMGNMYILDSVSVTATAGTHNTTRSDGGSAGTSRSFAINGNTGMTGGGGGGAGGTGGAAANIGGGGAGGGGGGGGATGTLGAHREPAGHNTAMFIGAAGGGGGGGFNNVGGNGGAGSTMTNATRLWAGNSGTTSSSTNGAAGGTAVNASYINGHGKWITGGAGSAGGNVGTGGAGGNVYVLTTDTVSAVGGGTATGRGEGATRHTTLTSFSIAYNANGENVSGMPDNGIKYQGITEFITNVTPTRTGFTFIGWNTNATATTASHAANAAYTANANLTLFAIWESSFSATARVEDQTKNFTARSDNLQYVLDNHIVTDEDIANGNSITLTLTVNETDDLADGALSIIELSQGRLLQFFDITVQKQINNDTPIPLTELPAPVQITIDLSPELSGRTGYTVYRFHDNSVQQLGMDTEAEEFFTVSRGTSENGTDQVIIHTMRFSTYAVVENIVTLHDADSHEDVDVQARIVDLTAPVYKIDIEWGDMKFVFNTGSDGLWNPDTREVDGVVVRGWHGFEEGNNEIIVTNHSNAGVRVSFEVSENSFEGDVDMKVNQVNNDSDNLAVDMELVRVPAQYDSAPSINAFLRIDGEPSDEDIENFADVWHRVGIITVTITPDGIGLTPRR